MAAQDRDLPDRVADWYENWIFLFVAWCLKAPPHCVRRDRINDFWWALTDHPEVGRWKVCQAMDALALLFGAVGETDALSFSEAPSTAQVARDGGIEHPSRYLPDGRLPEDVDPRDAVPTRAEAPAEPREPATEEVESPPPSAAPSPGRPESPRTLFNPTGASSTDDEPSGDACRATGEEEPADAPDTARTEELVSVDVPRPAAQRLRAVARRLDLPEPLLVARAIDVLRDRIDEVSGENGGGDPLRRYRAQIDLLSRRGPADWSIPRTSDQGGEARGGDRSTPDRPESDVKVEQGRGDGWTGRAPVLDIQDN
jgi:hypothetical protein